MEGRAKGVAEGGGRRPGEGGRPGGGIDAEGWADRAWVARRCQDGATFKEIGAELGVSASRVGQLAPQGVRGRREARERRRKEAMLRRAAPQIEAAARAAGRLTHGIAREVTGWTRGRLEGWLEQPAFRHWAAWWNALRAELEEGREADLRAAWEARQAGATWGEIERGAVAAGPGGQRTHRGGGGVGGTPRAALPAHGPQAGDEGPGRAQAAGGGSPAAGGGDGVGPGRSAHGIRQRGQRAGRSTKGAGAPAGGEGGGQGGRALRGHVVPCRARDGGEAQGAGSPGKGDEGRRRSPGQGPGNPAGPGQEGGMDTRTFDAMPAEIGREDLPAGHWARKLSSPGERIPKGVLLIAEKGGEITAEVEAWSRNAMQEMEGTPAPGA